MVCSKQFPFFNDHFIRDFGGQMALQQSHIGGWELFCIGRYVWYAHYMFDYWFINQLWLGSYIWILNFDFPPPSQRMVFHLFMPVRRTTALLSLRSHKKVIGNLLWTNILEKCFKDCCSQSGGWEIDPCLPPISLQKVANCFLGQIFPLIPGPKARLGGKSIKF